MQITQEAAKEMAEAYERFEMVVTEWVTDNGVDLFEEELVRDEIGDLNCHAWSVEQAILVGMNFVNKELQFTVLCVGEGDHDADRIATPNQLEITIGIHLPEFWEKLRNPRRKQKAVLTVIDVSVNEEGFTQ